MKNFPSLSLLLFSVITIFSCKNDDISGNIPNNSVSLINSMSNPNLDFKIGYDSIVQIPNETFYLSDIDKFYIDSNIAILLDRKAQIILYKQSTDSNWEKLGKLGAGPQEVEDITSFAYNSFEKQIYLYSRTSLVIMIYNLNGELISRKKVGVYAYDFEIMDDDKLIFYTNYASNKSKHLLILFDMNKEIPIKYLNEYNAEEVIAWDITGFLTKGINSMYFSPAFSDTIFCIKDLQYQPAYILRATDERLLKIRRQHMKIYESQIILDASTSFQRNLFFEGLDFIITSKLTNRTLDWGIYNKSSGRFNWVNENNLTGIPFHLYPEPAFVDSRNYLWLTILPENIENYLKERKGKPHEALILKDILSGSNNIDYSNPLLIRCKIKFE